MRPARPIQQLIDQFERLPGIGPKTAARLTYYLLHLPQEKLDEFAASLHNLKLRTRLCSLCKNVSEQDPCPICSDPAREKSLVCVVEQPLDLLSFERSGKFPGVYHVLHGVISPLQNIGPDQLFIPQLFSRLKNFTGASLELILATNPSMEGEATALYISQQLKEMQLPFKLKITRLGQGLPIGADIEYADQVTLSQALENRREIN
jgi:recombination protein RecR